MFVVNSLPTAILFCFITMLGWGSWANTQKLAGKDHWPFPLYYWDYAFGVLLCAAVFLFALGRWGNVGSAESGAIRAAIVSGVEFNIANVLLVAAIDSAGMAVAFPLGVGLALVIGSIKAYIADPKGNAPLLFCGVALIVLAMIFSGLAHRKLAQRTAAGKYGLLFAIVAGSLMGLFYPQLMRAISPDFRSSPIQSGLLTPYTALLFFAVGVVVSNFVVNPIFMRRAGLTMSAYAKGSARLHSLGLLGGAIWMIALTLNVLASGVAGPAISYALGQGATLIAAIWGVFIWREFKDAPRSAGVLLAAMFAGYAGGLFLIGLATQY
jgi:glucose uptake protein